ncbi:hypothetical protein CSC04_2511 [Enterobacter roggenkampii]|nr:hypothetical protein CSC04_2511 [Enterobacter roggenkampii]
MKAMTTGWQRTYGTGKCLNANSFYYSNLSGLVFKYLKKL